MAIPPELAAAAAAIERRSGDHVATIETVALLPLIDGHCVGCHSPIRYLNAQLCDACLDRRIAAKQRRGAGSTVRADR